MDTLTALSGSGPAYFFLFMEALEAAVHERGLPTYVAHRLTVETAFGDAQMARLSHPARASDFEVGHHRGSAGVLDAAGLRAIVARAVAAADRRSAELAAEFRTP